MKTSTFDPNFNIFEELDQESQTSKVDVELLQLSKRFDMETFIDVDTYLEQLDVRKELKDENSKNIFGNGHFSHLS